MLRARSATTCARSSGASAARRRHPDRARRDQPRRRAGPDGRGASRGGRPARRRRPQLRLGRGRRLLASSGSAAEINRYLERRPEHAAEDLMVVLLLRPGQLRRPGRLPDPDRGRAGRPGCAGADRPGHRRPPRRAARCCASGQPFWQPRGAPLAGVRAALAGAGAYRSPGRLRELISRPARPPRPVAEPGPTRWLNGESTSSSRVRRSRRALFREGLPGQQHRRRQACSRRLATHRHDDPAPPVDRPVCPWSRQSAGRQRCDSARWGACRAGRLPQGSTSPAAVGPWTLDTTVARRHARPMTQRHKESRHGGAAHPLPRPGPAQPTGRLGLAADRRPWTGCGG